MALTLVANAINAGSISLTTYGFVGAVSHDFDFGILQEYIADMQGARIILAIVWTGARLALDRRNGPLRLLPRTLFRT